MKKKYIIYIVFSILLILKFCTYKIDRIYGLTLISNIWIHIIKLIVIYFGFKIAKKEKLFFLIYVIIFIYLSLTLGDIYKNLVAPKFTFNSPNKTNTLIVEDRSSLHSGYSFLYEKKYYIFKKELPYEPLFGYKIFPRKVYTMKWVNENEVTISYTSQDNKEKEITIDFNKENQSK